MPKIVPKKWQKNEEKHAWFNGINKLINYFALSLLQKTDSEAEHLQRAAFYTAAEQACQRLEKRLKKHVGKAQPYFEQKEAFNKTLEAQKAQVQQLQSKVSIAKVSFSPFKNIRSLCLNFLFQNLPYFWNLKTHIIFIYLIFSPIRILDKSIYHLRVKWK